MKPENKTIRDRFIFYWSIQGAPKEYSKSWAEVMAKENSRIAKKYCLGKK